MQASHLLTVIWEKSRLGFKAESRKNYLSYSWLVIEPVLQMVCYYLIFGVLFDRGGADFVFFLLVGLVPWIWFSKALSQSSSSLVANKGLINRLYIPKVYFPLVALVQISAKQLIPMAFVLVLLVFAGYKVSLLWLGILFLWLVQFMTMVWLGLMLAYLVAYVPDLRQIIAPCIQLGFFMSGIFYDIDTIGEKYPTLVLLNPMAQIIRGFRGILLEGRPPDASYFLMIFLVGGVLTLMMLFLYHKHDRKIAKIVQE